MHSIPNMHNLSQHNHNRSINYRTNTLLQHITYSNSSNTTTLSCKVWLRVRIITLSLPSMRRAMWRINIRRTMVILAILHMVNTRLPIPGAIRTVALVGSWPPIKGMCLMIGGEF